MKLKKILVVLYLLPIVIFASNKSNNFRFKPTSQLGLVREIVNVKDSNTRNCDYILLKSGEEIEANIISTLNFVIEYAPCGIEINGALILDKKLIFYIKYKDGTKVTFQKQIPVSELIQSGLTYEEKLKRDKKDVKTFFLCLGGGMVAGFLTQVIIFGIKNDWEFRGFTNPEMSNTPYYVLGGALTGIGVSLPLIIHKKQGF